MPDTLVDLTAPPSDILSSPGHAMVGAGDMEALWTDYQRTRRHWLRLSAAETRARESGADKDQLAQMKKSVAAAEATWYAALHAIVDAGTTSPEGLIIKLKVLAEMMGWAVRPGARPKDIRERIVMGAIRDLGAVAGMTTARAATKH